MSWSEFRDWLAVCRAEEILNRLDFQDDLAYARGFDAAGVFEARRSRRMLLERYKDLMCVHAGEEARAKSTWDTLNAGIF